MATRSFDVVILGGGNAGMGVTVATREAGLSVAMIEPDLLGGTCPNRGCMPKKVLVAAAHALDEIERAKAHHIAVGTPSLDWAALIAHPALEAEVQREVDAANLEFSRVEQVKRVTILPDEWSPVTDELTPTLKVKRKVVRDKYGDAIEAMYREGA